MIRTAHEDEWMEARRLRIEMLGDAPHAFDAGITDVETWDGPRWRGRLRSALMPDSVLLVATDARGQWLGQMGAREYLHHDPARVWLLEVYVSPPHRGGGLAAELLAGIEEWAKDRGHHKLYLDVHEHAAAARRFYVRHDFVESGVWQPHPRNPGLRELEMVKDLPPSDPGSTDPGLLRAAPGGAARTERRPWMT